MAAKAEVTATEAVKAAYDAKEAEEKADTDAREAEEKAALA